MKLGRNYHVKITDPNGDTVEIDPPFTLHFTVDRNSLATANTGSLEFMNLGPSTRNRLYKDRFANSLLWHIELWAGYAENLFLILKGNIRESFSYKRGPDWHTEIQVFDGADAFKNGFVAQAFSSAVQKPDLVRKVIETLPGIQTGFLGAYAQGEGPKRAMSLFGPTREVLQGLTAGRFFIDNGVLHVMDDYEYDGTDTLDLDESEILETPRRQNATLDLSILFYPQARVAVPAVLKSLYPIYNGTYKICGFRHDVLISESENGTAKTDLNLFLIGPNGDATGLVFKALTS